MKFTIPTEVKELVKITWADFEAEFTELQNKS